MIGDSSGYPKDKIVTTTMDPLTGEVITTIIDDESSVSWSNATIASPSGIVQYTDGTSYGNLFNPTYLTNEQCKKAIIDMFSSLTKYQRERLINRLEDNKILSDIAQRIAPHCGRITTMEDLLLAHVSPEELRQLHAQLLIEEEIK